MSVREQASEVVKMLRAGGRVSFRALLGGARDRGVIIARFLAILELYRLAAVSFEQVSPLGDLEVQWAGKDFDDEKLATLGVDYGA